jgi:beta-glucanase (GH16 family)
MNRSSFSLVAAALAMAASLACGDAQDASPSPAAGDGAALRTSGLSDQLNAYDSSVWQMANWANGSPFNCGFLPDHVSFSGGFMTLKLDNTASAGKSYSCGEYRTSDTVSYGRFETRMKAAKASGIVSSFFTYTGSPWDEIDVEILGKNTSQVQFNYFVNGTGGHERVVDLGFDASAGYHTYAIDWQPNAISWYVDGVLKHSVSGSTSTLPSHPMQIMMNLWNGIGVDGWLGSFGYAGPLYASYDYVTYTPAGSSSYALTVSKSGTGSGTITSSAGGINCGSTCSATLASGTSVTLTASPASGSTFGGWGGSCGGTNTTCVVSMIAARSVTATFNSTGGGTFGLSVSKGGTGSGTVTSSTGGINCGSACSATLSSGTSVTLTASPDSGSTFGGWSGSCGGTNTTCVVSMTAARSVTATFNSTGGGTCKAVSGGQSGNFATTGAVCFTVTGTINGWGCSNVDGRTVTVNGTGVTCGKLPLPGASPYTFSFTAGTYPWASFYWW